LSYGFIAENSGKTSSVTDEARRLSVLARLKWPHALVALSTLYGLVALRGETRFAQPLNDSAFHMQMVRWAGGQIHHGRVPLDGWYPWLSLGSSFFHHYESLPETLTAYAAAATGASNNTAYLWLLYLPLATWPISVYAGSRLLGWGRWTAAGAAAVAPLLVSAPGYGFEWGSYVWGGIGLYGQLWAMWLLPLAWGLTWRSVKDGRRYAAAAIAVALTIACHFIAGYLALLTIGVWVIVLGVDRVVPRIIRAAAVAGGAMLISLWVLVPLIEGTTWTNSSEFFHYTVFDDSYGTRQVLSWLVRGQLFDHGRFPVITLLFAGGLGVCIWRARRDARARALLGVFILSLILFCGRHSLGPVLGWLPGSADVQFQRFEMGVDLAGVLIAGVGVGAGVNALRRLWDQRIPSRHAGLAGAAAIVLVVVVLAQAWSGRWDFAQRSAGFIRQQQTYDSTSGRAIGKLITTVKRLRDGRVYAGLRSNWGEQYTVGFVPMYAWLADHDVDQVGFTFRTLNSLSTDVEATFDEKNLAQYKMLGIRYLLLPDGHKPPVPAKLIASAGGSRLYSVATGGYFQVVDRSAAITADRTDVEHASAVWRGTQDALHDIYPGVAFAGGSPPVATFAGATPPRGKPGDVLRWTENRPGGVFAASVAMRRRAIVLLKASYDPSWTATVDGRAVKPVMMAPSLVGVEVGPGRHSVRFRYSPYGAYPWLLAIGILTALGLAILPRRASFAGRLGRRR
jgi:hypothetical protein